MFSQLSDRLESAFKRLKGQHKISESNITDALREVRLGLLEADVDLTVTKAFIEAVKERALGAEVLKSVSPEQQIIKIFHDELTALLGGDATPLDLTPPARILVCGLNGAGKTTTCAKLARLLKKEGKKPVLVALDLYRPAAIKQLQVLAEEVGVSIFAPPVGETSVIKMARAAVEWLGTVSHDVVIFDTAGRQEIDEALVAELQEVATYLQPQETLLVADAATGQQAVSVATHFHGAVGITGLILTKLDGDARGGAALSMRSVTQRPIKFIGVGEKIDQLERLVPGRLADRILGMGDVVGLVEKAAEAIEEKDAMRMIERFTSGAFDFTDFLSQMKFMRKLGPLEGILKMMPGMGALKDMNIDEKQMKHVEAIVLSMTQTERKKPELLNASRRQRIAKGSGRALPEVNRLVDQVMGMRKMFAGGQMQKMMKKMGGKGMPSMDQMKNLPGMPDLSQMDPSQMPDLSKGLGGLGGLGGLKDLLGGLGGLSGPGGLPMPPTKPGKKNKGGQGGRFKFPW
jgi:signal recognition particle subunit SRP54